MSRQNTMLIPVEPAKAINVLPYLLVRGVKNVRAISVNHDACVFVFVRIAVPTYVVALFDEQHAFAMLMRLLRKDRAE
jgi:hypothetical protein